MGKRVRWNKYRGAYGTRLMKKHPNIEERVDSLDPDDWGHSYGSERSKLERANEMYLLLLERQAKKYGGVDPYARPMDNKPKVVRGLQK